MLAAHLTLVFAAVFAGAEWQKSYNKAAPMQGGLLLGFLAAWQLHDWRFVVGALLILANWPYTLLVIKPTNDRLHAIKPEQANAETRQAIIAWGHLHGGRSAFGVAATLFFLWALTA